MLCPEIDSTGVADRSTDFVAYPNPAHDEVFVKMRDGGERFSFIEVLDLNRRSLCAVPTQELTRVDLSRLPAAYREKIAVGVDVNDGFVAVKGWTETSAEDVYTFCNKLQKQGVRTVICTDIGRDGAMQGANGDLYKTLSARFDMDFVASGGVSSTLSAPWTARAM